MDAVEEPVERAPRLDAHELAELRRHRRHVAQANTLLDIRQRARPLSRDFLGLQRRALLRLQIVKVFHPVGDLDVERRALFVGGVLSRRGGLQRAQRSARLGQLDFCFS